MQEPRKSRRGQTPGVYLATSRELKPRRQIIPILLERINCPSLLALSKHTGVNKKMLDSIADPEYDGFDHIRHHLKLAKEANLTADEYFALLFND